MSQTFLVFATNEQQEYEKLSNQLKDYAQILLKHIPQMPDANCTQIVQRFIPDSYCGFYYLTFTDPKTQAVQQISEIIDNEYAVIAFGWLPSFSPNIAKEILSVYKVDGVKGVKELEGCFSSVIINRVNKEITLLSDLAGQKRLRYFSSDQNLLVSPHDLSLLATGLIKLNFDPISLLNYASFGCSLEGKSLLKDVSTCHPSEYYIWNYRTMEKFTDSLIDSKLRIEEDNKKAILNQVSNMIDYSRQTFKQVSSRPEFSEISIGLSAGIDSRAVLSLLLSIIDDPNKIVVRTYGNSQSLDVRIARELCQTRSIKFENTKTNISPNQSLETFLNLVDHHAFAANANYTARLAAIYPSLPQIADPNSLFLGGQGGENYRGKFYPKQDYIKGLDTDSAFKAIYQFWRPRISKVLSHDPDLMNEFIQQFQISFINRYSQFSTNGFDILDLYYWYERTGVWDCWENNSPWIPRMWSPFRSKQLKKMSFILPPPIGKARLLPKIIKQLWPNAYWFRINGKRSLPLEDFGNNSSFLTKVDNKLLSYSKKIRNKLSLSKVTAESDDLEALRRNSFNVFHPVISDILMAENSFCQAVLGKEKLRQLLSKAQSNNNQDVDIVGVLLTVERWTLIARNIFQDARRPC